MGGGEREGETGGGVAGGGEGGRERGGEEREREVERENSNSKTLFYEDCSLGSVKNLTERENERMIG